MFFQLCMWEFPKIGDPNILPEIVGSLLEGPQNKVPLIFGNSHAIISTPPLTAGASSFGV